jgi:hypothetical protein
MLDQALRPRSYFEIGTSAGCSVSVISCPAICVDPTFARTLADDLVGNKRQLHLFQMRSDDFFASFELTRLFPDGIDLAFLDGMHNFEFLLRDFINTERYCHRRSLLLMHDCLPTNHRMAWRQFIAGPEDEPTRFSWAGDVWKIVPVLKQFRPELKIFLIDCGPTGLIACTNLNPNSTVLTDYYFEAIDTFGQVELQKFGPDRLLGLYPMLDSVRLCANPSEVGLIFANR